MKWYLTKPLQLVAVLLAISMLTFLLLNALPGNAAEIRIGPLPNFTPAQRAQTLKLLEHQLGLDRPVYVLFVIWLEHAAMGDFGFTIQGGPV